MIFVLVLAIFLPTAGCVCINGWVAHNGTCYHFSHDLEQVSGALYMCNVMGGRLIELDEPSKIKYVEMVAKLFEHNFWIGLADIAYNGEWAWLDSKRKLKDTGYTNWDTNQPNGNTDHCVSLLYASGRWRNVNCLNEMHFICESRDDIGTLPVG